MVGQISAKRKGINALLSLNVNSARIRFVLPKALFYICMKLLSFAFIVCIISHIRDEFYFIDVAIIDKLLQGYIFLLSPL